MKRIITVLGKGRRMLRRNEGMNENTFETLKDRANVR